MNTLDIVRLVDLVTAEVLEALARTGPATCRCHATLVDCCPQRVGPIVEAGATRLSLYAAGASADLASFIDHTMLKPDATQDDVEGLCREAREAGFATVCVNPTWVSLAAVRLQGSAVGVCSVVGFPLGATTADVKRYEAEGAIFDGASEVDMVINVGALKSGDMTTVQDDVSRVVEVCRRRGVASKVIIEAALLTREEKVRACQVARQAGATFVKTSTGFGPGGATIDDVVLMRETVGPAMGIKAAGGIKTYAAAKALISAGATRIGASASVRIVEESRARAAAADRVADSSVRASRRDR